MKPLEALRRRAPSVPPPGEVRVAARIDTARPRRRAALRRRLQQIIDTLERDTTGATSAVPGERGEPGDRLSTRALVERLCGLLDPPEPERIWLLHAVLVARLPAPEMIVQAARRARLDGPAVAIDLALDHAFDRTLNLAPDANLRLEIPDDTGWPDVEVVTGEVVVDLHHTAQTKLATGIQRVAREVARRWAQHRPVFVQWGNKGTAMHRLTPAEITTALSGEGMSDDVAPGDPTVLVPWRCTYVLPEVAVERNRVRALMAFLQFSGSTGGSIGFDCVPMTSNETVNVEVGGYFAFGMSVTRHLDRVATISEGAAVEYRGWASIVRGTGVAGPEVHAVPLAVEAAAASPAAIDTFADRFGVPTMPMVLMVASQEPRKNHLAVLHAAEVVWRKGVRFCLLLVGGQSWRSEAVEQRLKELQAGGRLIETVTALPEDLLWAAYQRASVVLFPSLNEGFGLPVAEALATGTPVITSKFGPMAEIAAHGGALFVDPRDDHDLAGALERVLTEPGLCDRLAARAAAAPMRTWDQYAAEVWDYLVPTGERSLR